MLQKSPDSGPVVETPADIAKVLNTGAPARRLRRWLLVAVVAIVAVGGFWYWHASSTRTAAVTYVTAPVTRGDLTVTVTATGTVEPTDQVDISSELSGTIASVNADFNDRVTQGSTLATLDTDKLNSNVSLSKATLEARQADVQQAQATVEQTSAALGRQQKLASQSLASTETLDAAKADADRAAAALTSANANLDIAKANLDIAQSDLTKATIVSPVDGIVLSRDVEVGQTVASSLQAPVLFTLAQDLTKMELQVAVDEADVGKVKEGDTATFTVEAYADRKFPATISQVRYSPVTVEGVTTYTAVLTVDNSDLTLRPGMTATADITVDQVKDALLVPNGALRYTPPVREQNTASRPRGGGLLGLLLPSGPGGNRNRTTITPTAAAASEHTLWVLRDGSPVAVRVTTGVTDGTHTVIASGDLKEGDQVITGSRSATAGS
ncbi:MAG TPA: efflux RND transporter periplasmic adaptor subunit [Bauldia sp.]|nr:efflux RND transporter periplasmic adaptor subunit [Bauldia sp.]